MKKRVKLPMPQITHTEPFTVQNPKVPPHELPAASTPLHSILGSVHGKGESLSLESALFRSVVPSVGRDPRRYLAGSRGGLRRSVFSLQQVARVQKNASQHGTR